MLAPVDHVLVAPSFGEGAYGGPGLIIEVVGIGACIRLRPGQSQQEQVVRQELRQPLVPLFVAQLGYQPGGFGIASPDDAGEALVGRPEFLQYERQREIVRSLAPELLRDRRGPQAQLGGLLDQIPRDAVFRVFLRVECHRDGLHFFLRKLANHVARHFLFVSQSEVHRCPFRSRTFVCCSCRSSDPPAPPRCARCP